MNPSPTAIHEAGHAVVAHVLDVELGNVSIQPDEDTLGRSFSEDSNSLNNVLIYFAGFAAEIRFAPEREADARRGSCSDDERAAKYLKVLGETDDTPFREEANCMVAQNWRAILFVAYELDHWQGLDDTETETLIGLAKGDGQNTIEDLASYRVAVSRIEKCSDSLEQERERLHEVFARLP